MFVIFLIFVEIFLAMSDVLNNSAIVKNFSNFLEKGNYRKTPERFAVLSKALAFNKPFTAEQLCQQLQSDAFKVSQSTVYSNCLPKQAFFAGFSMKDCKNCNSPA